VLGNLASIGRTAFRTSVGAAKRLGVKPVVRAGIVAVLAAALSFGVTFVVYGLVAGHTNSGGALSSSAGSNRRLAPKMVLSANTDFLVTSAISSSASCTNVTLFFPGDHIYLCYTVHNPYTQPFTVTSLKISKTTAPATCPASNLDLSGTSYSGTPALVVAAHGTETMAEPISMLTTATNQDVCLGTVFNFTNAGQARLTTSAVTPTTTPAPTPTSTPTPTPPAPTTPLAVTGADIAGTVSVGVLFIVFGGLLVLAAMRRRRRAAEALDEGSAP